MAARQGQAEGTHMASRKSPQLQNDEVKRLLVLYTFTASFAEPRNLWQNLESTRRSVQGSSHTISTYGGVK